MDLSPLDRARKRIGYTMLAAVALPAAWALTPAWWHSGPPTAAAETVAAGRDLFVHDWQPNDPLAHGDGLGPVFNARSCAACHQQGGLGGGGALASNVTTYAVRNLTTGKLLNEGMIHMGATEPSFLETQGWFRSAYPSVTIQVRNPCNCPPFLPVTKEPLAVASINSPALFGAGWIDRLSGKELVQANVAAAARQISREFSFEYDGVNAGRPRFLAGGRVGKFGWKGQFATLEEFVAAACANELGLGTPGCPQAQPARRPEHPASAPDLNRQQFAALVAFVDTLPRPVEVVPEDSAAAAHAHRGKEVFHSVGCAVCHPADVAGLQGVYSDFLLHAVESVQSGSGGNGYGDRLLPDPEIVGPAPNEWKTPALWGVADSAPYFHDGATPTLEGAIRRHGGTAKPVTDRFTHLSTEDRDALLAFLGTLRAPAAAEPFHTPRNLAAR